MKKTVTSLKDLGQLVTTVVVDQRPPAPSTAPDKPEPSAADTEYWLRQFEQPRRKHFGQK